MMKFGGMRSAPSLLSPPDQLWLTVFTPNIILSLGQLEMIYYITYDMDFRFVPRYPVCLDKLSRIWQHIRAVGYNRCVTRRGHVIWTTRSDLDRGQRIGVERGTRSRSGRLWRACKRVQALVLPGSLRGIWEEEVLSLSICLSIYLSTNNKLWALFRK